MSEDSNLTKKLEEVENKKQFSEEEMKKLRDVQIGYSNIRSDFGQLYMSRIRLSEQEKDLENFEAEINKRFQDLQNEEKAFLDKTTEKYGQGTLDPDTGIFTPTSVENTSNKSE